MTRCMVRWWLLVVVAAAAAAVVGVVVVSSSSNRAHPVNLEEQRAACVARRVQRLDLEVADGDHVAVA